MNADNFSDLFLHASRYEPDKSPGPFSHTVQRHESGKFLGLVFWHASRHESRKFLGICLIHTSRHVSDKSPAPFSYIFQRHESGQFLGLFSGMRQDMNPESFYDVSSMFQGMSPTNRRVCFPYTKA